MACGSAPFASFSVIVSWPPCPKAWMVAVLAMVAVPPVMATAPPLTRSWPAALRVISMVLFEASPNTLSVCALARYDAVTAGMSRVSSDSRPWSKETGSASGVDASRAASDVRVAFRFVIDLSMAPPSLSCRSVDDSCASGRRSRRFPAARHAGRALLLDEPFVRGLGTGLLGVLGRQRQVLHLARGGALLPGFRHADHLLSSTRLSSRSSLMATSVPKRKGANFLK